MPGPRYVQRAAWCCCASSAALFAGARPGAASTACFYTNAPDGDFAIDLQPGSDRVLVVSACSGHGFKHSAGVGEHVARLLTGEDRLQAAFALNRPALE